MKRKILAALLSTAIAAPVIAGPAQAQDSDIVVMRRALTKPKIIFDENDPTPSPTAEYRLTRLIPGEEMTDASQVPVQVAGLQCYNKGQQVHMGQCADIALPDMPAQTISGFINPALRVVVVDRVQVDALAQQFGVENDVCSGTISRDSGTWQISCDPSDQVIPDHVRMATSVKVVNAQAFDEKSLELDFYNIRCFDRDGTPISSTCAATEITGTSGKAIVPAKSNYDLRTVIVSREEVLRHSWRVDAEDLCSSSASLMTAAGMQTWKVRCDEEELRIHYQKYPTQASKTVTTLPASQYLVDTAASGVRCRDTDTGEDAADQSKCTYLPTPSNVGLISVPSAVNEQTRTLAIDIDPLLSVAPDIRNVDAFCSGTTPVVVDGVKESWWFRCGLDQIDQQYARMISVISDPAMKSGGWSNNYIYPEDVRFSNSGTDGDALTLGVYGTTCWDLTNDVAASDPAQCTHLSGPERLDVFSVSAQYSTPLRTVLINPDEVREYAPKLSDASLDDLCSSTFSIGGPGGLQDWKIRCDPAELEVHYEKYIRSILDPDYSSNFGSNQKANNVLAPDLLNIGIYQVGCWDTKNNVHAADQSKCTFLPGGPRLYDVFSVPAQSSLNLRTIVIEPNDVKAIAPRLSDAQLENLCSSNYTLYPTSGGSQEWKVRCDASEIAEHYEKYVLSVVDPSISGHFGSSRYVNSTLAPDSLSIGIYQVHCWDLESNAPAADQSKCTYLAEGPRLYDVFSVPAASSLNLRTIVIDPDDVKSVAPRLSDTQINNLCSSNFTLFPSSGGAQDWKVRCDPAELDEHYRKYIASIIDPSRSGNFGSNRYVNNTLAPDSLNIGIYQVSCWDELNNIPAADQSKCTYLQEGPRLYDVFSVPAQSSLNLRTIVIEPSDVRAVAPRISDAQISSICRSSFTLFPSSGGSQDWKVRCDVSEIDEHYQKYVTSFAVVNGAHSFGDNRYINSTLSPNRLYFGNYTVGCWNTKTGAAAADQSKCDYLTGGPTQWGVFSVPVQSSLELRTTVVSREDILAAVPHATASQLNSICNSSFRIYPSGTGLPYEDWKLRCDPGEIAEHYERYIYDAYVVNGASYFGDNRYINNTRAPSALYFGAYVVSCWDTEINAHAADQSKCDYLSKGPERYDTFSISAQSSLALRTTVINPADLVAAAPHLSASRLNNICNSSFRIYPNGTGLPYEDWKLRCDPGEIAEHYERYISDAIIVNGASYFGDNRYINHTLAPSILYLGAYQVSCWDTESSANAADQSKCDYLPEGPQRYDVFPVPVRSNLASKTSIISRAELVAAIPRVSASRINSICSSSFRIYPNQTSAYETWTLQCD